MNIGDLYAYIADEIEKMAAWEKEAKDTTVATWAAGMRTAYEDVLSLLESKLRHERDLSPVTMKSRNEGELHNAS